MAFFHEHLLESAGIKKKQKGVTLVAATGTRGGKIHACDADLPQEPCPKELIGNDGLPAQCLTPGLLFSIHSFRGVANFNYRNLEAVPDHTWVEVVHHAVPRERTELWMYRATGSGVWYNVRTSRIFSTHSDAWDAFMGNTQIEFTGANKPAFKVAEEQGYTSLQYVRHADRECGAGFGSEKGQNLKGSGGDRAWAIEIVDLGLDGEYACGFGNDEDQDVFRAGWDAMYKCKCLNQLPGLGNRKGQIPLNCQGFQGYSSMVSMLHNHTVPLDKKLNRKSKDKKRLREN